MSDHRTAYILSFAFLTCPLWVPLLVVAFERALALWERLRE